MKILKNMKFISSLLFLSFIIIMGAPIEIIAAQPTVNLGTTSSFTILAGETITNIGE